MTFSPLPGPFLDEVGAVASLDHAAVDLGCGDGAFTGLLARHGLRAIGLDLLPPAAGGGPMLVGDALAAPLRPQSCDLLTAANVVRHLAAGRPSLDFLAAWAGLLKPGRALYVFEDAPRPAGGPQGNHAALQDFLARLMPGRRGPLLASAVVAEAAGRFGLACRGGSFLNTWPQDAEAVIRMLDAGRPRPGGEAAALRAAIERDGLACGPAWWLRITKGSA